MNGTDLGTSHEIKSLLIQNHIDPPSFLVQRQPLMRLALRSQPLVAPWTISNFWPPIGHRQKSISVSDILGKQKSIKVFVLCIGFAWQGFGSGGLQGWLL